jgi:hypothetical protein
MNNRATWLHTVRKILAISLWLAVPLAFAQEQPTTVDQFLDAFHGKPVGQIAPISALPGAPVPAPISSLPTIGEGSANTTASPSQAASQSSQPAPPSCPPGVDRVGCPPTSGWRSRTDCAPGMAVSAGGCVPTAMPPNAHRVSSDGQWQCDDGYLRYGAICMPMRTPANAHLSSGGEGWECNTGYRRIGNACVTINVPPNAHLEATYSGWSCDSGYRQAGNWCISQTGSN